MVSWLKELHGALWGLFLSKPIPGRYANEGLRGVVETMWWVMAVCMYVWLSGEIKPKSQALHTSFIPHHYQTKSARANLVTGQKKPGGGSSNLPLTIQVEPFPNI